MNVREYYEHQSLNADWRSRFYSCAKNGDGSVFKFLNTNYRNILSFEYYFNEFLKLENLPRNKWQVKETTGQEIAKQYVSGMTDTFLFSKNRDKSGELVYKLTFRGKAYKDMLAQDFSSEEKTLLTILFILNASFLKTPRYIVKASQSVFEHFSAADIDLSKIKEDIVTFLKNQSMKTADIFGYDIIWLTGFFTDESFLKLYAIADNPTKNNLHENTKSAYEQGLKNNLLAWKYKSTNFSKATLIDTLSLLYICLCLEEQKQNGTQFETFIKSIIEDYSVIYSLNRQKLSDFIFKHYDMFKIIYENFMSAADDFTENYTAPLKNKNIKIDPNEKIDTTSKDGIEKLEIVREVLKKLAKEKSKYKCALETINQCKYFTGKEERQNFLEIHHFIPREFAYEFEDTIEFVENYVPLCPHCHRMIHKAMDRERKGIIHYLFNQRIADLKKNKIDINIKELYEFYKIDE